MNAFYWLAARVRSKALGVWTFLGFIISWWLFMCLGLNFRWNDESLSFTTAVMLSSVLKLWIGIEAGQRLAEDRKIGALELLLSTPLRVKDILGGQLLALRRQFLKPFLFSMAFLWVLLVMGGRQSLEENARSRALGLAGMLMFVTDALALTWVAMAAALTVRNPSHTSIRTIFRVLLLPWLIFLPIGIFVSTGSGMAGSDKPSWKFYLFLWFTLGLLADLGFGFAAWKQLRNRFRLLALESLSPQSARAP